MESFLNETKEFDELFKRLDQMQNYLFEIKKLELYMLPEPTCLQNAYVINMHKLRKKWPDKFPSLDTIEKFIENEKKLFFLPQQYYYYYLYYHLLIAYKKFHEKYPNKEIYDDKTILDYEIVSEYLSRKNLNATKFFELYFEKGVDQLNDEDLIYAKIDDSTIEAASDYLMDENISHEMSSEPSAPPLEMLESEVEVPKSLSPLSFVVEKNIQDFTENIGKKARENEIY